MGLLEKQKQLQHDKDNEHRRDVERLNQDHHNALQRKIDEIEALEKKFAAEKLQMDKEFRETMAFMQSEHAEEKKNLLQKHSDELKRRDDEKAKRERQHLDQLEDLQ